MVGVGGGGGAVVVKGGAGRPADPLGTFFDDDVSGHASDGMTSINISTY